MRQQRMPSRLPRLGEQSAPVAIRRSDEASRHVVAEKRDGGGVAAVGHRARAAGLGGILGVGASVVCAPKAFERNVKVPSWNRPLG